MPRACGSAGMHGCDVRLDGEICGHVGPPRSAWSGTASTKGPTGGDGVHRRRACITLRNTKPLCGTRIRPVSGLAARASARDGPPSHDHSRWHSARPTAYRCGGSVGIASARWPGSPTSRFIRRPNEVPTDTQSRNLAIFRERREACQSAEPGRPGRGDRGTVSDAMPPAPRHARGIALTTSVAIPGSARQRETRIPSPDAASIAE